MDCPPGWRHKPQHQPWGSPVEEALGLRYSCLEVLSADVYHSLRLVPRSNQFNRPLDPDRTTDPRTFLVDTELCSEA